MTLLEVRGVTKRFGGLIAVDRVSFDVEAGAILGIIGPNGAGKTTLLNVISGFARRDEGAVLLDGKDVSLLPPHLIARRAIARTFQAIRVFRELTVEENVLLGGHLTYGVALARSFVPDPGVRRAEEQLKQRARALLAELGLADKANVKTKNLAYGEQRRVDIARALASNPRILLLDEPMAGMARREAEGLAVFLRQKAAAGLTVVIIEHNLPMVISLCRAVIVLHFGARISQGTPAEILRDPNVREAYLGGAAGPARA